LAKFESSHFDEILCDPRYTLLAFVNGEVGPVNQFSVDLHKSHEEGKNQRKTWKVKFNHTCSKALE